MKLKISAGLFVCGRCRRRYRNPFGHVCITRLDRKARDGSTRLAPKLALSTGPCGKCHRPVGNPLTHVCTTRTDYKKRSAKAKKAAAAAKRKARPQHPRPSACRDDDCKRTGCVAYKEGRQDGYRDGYDDGFSDGIVACPREHR